MKVLLIEDEVKIANALQKGLTVEHFIVDVAYTGTEGKARALTGDYDVVVLDRMLPGVKDGLEICTAMREQGVVTPVLMLTAKDTVDDRVDGLDGGADDYLIKPFDFDELVARLRALLRRPSQFTSEIIEYANLSVDTRNYTVSRKGVPVSLSTTEYALLIYLLQHQKRTVTKQMIIDAVWPEDADILPNTVEVYIGYLRTKLEKKFPKLPQFIHTVRGFGYRCEVQA